MQYAPLPWHSWMIALGLSVSAGLQHRHFHQTFEPPQLGQAPHPHARPPLLAALCLQK